MKVKPNREPLLHSYATFVFCRSPKIFKTFTEPLLSGRPIVSPFHTEGFTFHTSSAVFNLLEKPALQCLNLQYMLPNFCDMERNEISGWGCEQSRCYLASALAYIFPLIPPNSMHFSPRVSSLRVYPYIVDTFHPDRLLLPPHIST